MMATLMKFQEQSVEAEIVELLHDLPADAKMTVKQFVRFMVDQNLPKDSKLSNGSDKTTSKSELQYPIKSISAASGLRLAEAMEGFGYEGDALADSETLYDALRQRLRPDSLA